MNILPFLLACCNQPPLLFILNEGFRIQEIPRCKYVVILQEGKIQSVPNCPTHFILKISYWRYCLLNSLLLGISSHGYLKDILWVLGYNNYFANVGLDLALFNIKVQYRISVHALKVKA